MFKLIAPRDLSPIPAAAAAAFVALAIFAWTERTVLVDPERMSSALLALEAVANRPVADGVRRRMVGAMVFANGYFVDNGVIWQILNPVRMLTALVWAAVAGHANVATPEAASRGLHG